MKIPSGSNVTKQWEGRVNEDAKKNQQKSVEWDQIMRWCALLGVIGYSFACRRAAILNSKKKCGEERATTFSRLRPMVG